jgi:hypothetical protein
VPPHSIIKGRSTGIVHPAGVTFNAADGEVIAPDAVWNGLFTFLKPELFKGGRGSEGAARGAGVPASDRAGVWGGAPRKND